MAVSLTFVWADVVAIAPSTVNAPTDMQTTIRNVVALTVVNDAWGSLANVAGMYLAAHLATLALRPGGAFGGVSSANVDAVAVSFTTMATKGLETTSYGQQYLELRGSIAAFRFPTSRIRGGLCGW